MYSNDTIGINGQILPIDYDMNSNQEEINQEMNNNIKNQMNQLSLQTKIQLSKSNGICGFLNLNNGYFITYSTKEILLFNKNLSYKKIFSSTNGVYSDEYSIKSVKYIKKGKFLFLYNYDLYLLRFIFIDY